MEQVEASLHDWPLATWNTKQDSDTNYKRVINYSLHPDRIRNIRIGVAGHNLFDIAFAWLLAKQRGVRVAASNSRCCSAWPRARPKPSRRTSAPSCSTPPWSTPPSSTSRSPT